MKQEDGGFAHDGNEERRYFLPGELIVAVKHLSEFSREEFVNNPVFFIEAGDTAGLLLNALSDIIGDEEGLVNGARKGAEVIMENRQWVGDALREPGPFVGKRGALSFVRLKIERITNEALIYLAGELEFRANPKDDIQKGEGQKVVGVSLNWLWSSTPDNLTTGGPGSLPVCPAPPWPNEEDEYELGTWHRDFKPAILRTQQSPNAQEAREKLKTGLLNHAHRCPIKVFILDTIPPRRILNKWAWCGNEYLKRLLCFLKCDSGSLYYYEDRLRKEDPVFNGRAHPYGIVGHLYNMSDHGLFIAGIIHKIAPHAHLHMIEVLNKYGVGSAQALIWGLQQIVERYKQNTWLVINSSLTISFSYDAIQEAIGKGIRPPLSDVERFLHLVEALDKSREDFSFSSPIQKQYDQVTTSFHNAISIAAAGNDNQAEKDGDPARLSRAAARFPAAYGSVIGVGALTRKGEIARYSNKPDNPEPEGFYVFGGDVDKKQDEKDKDSKWIASKTDGILGVYTHHTYPGEEKIENTSGWARWAGTSFASAMVTGILAHIAECNAKSIGPADHNATVELLRKVAEEKETVGHVLPVGQGKRGHDPR